MLSPPNVDLLPGIELVIVDIDNTLAIPKTSEFYRFYGDAVNRAVSSYLGISPVEGIKVADYYREYFGGGEMALFSGTIYKFFPQYGKHRPDLTLLYDELCTINPVDQFLEDKRVPFLLRLLHNQGTKIAAITDCPEYLSGRVLAEVGVDPNKDFDLYLSYTKERGPLKILQGRAVFSGVVEHFRVPAKRTLSIGDTYKYDIQPAQQLGMKTCLISAQIKKDYFDLQAKTFLHVFEVFRNSL